MANHPDVDIKILQLAVKDFLRIAGKIRSPMRLPGNCFQPNPLLTEDRAVKLFHYPLHHSAIVPHWKSMWSFQPPR